ncbi:MAG: hypothetical protein K2I93_06625 [Oscillospiraceae bacterium]|nr:hypothetical protein [Oscillospiraceae bacterium]
MQKLFRLKENKTDIKTEVYIPVSSTDYYNLIHKQQSRSITAALLFIGTT